MGRAILKENPELVRTLTELRHAAKRHDAPIWGVLARQLARGRHQRTPVNLAHLERLAQPDETLVVPGKVLGQGELTKALTIAAFHYSTEARAKIHRAGGKALSIDELIKSKPNGAGVRLFG